MSQRLLIVFRHGLGDCVQLTVVLQHLRQARPDALIDVQVEDAGKASIFTGLFAGVRAIAHDSERADHYDETFDLHWWEADSVDRDDVPATKAEQCLRRVFAIEPDAELCSYRCARDNISAVESYLRDIAGDIAGDSVDGRWPVIAIHYQGNTGADRKNLSHDIAGRICDEVRALGFVPLILDWDGRSPLPNGATIFCPEAGPPLWNGSGTGHAATLAALLDRVTLFIGIDSGPQKIAMTTQTPQVVFWRGFHPIHYCPPKENVTHVVPAEHARLIRGDGERGARLFSRYRSTSYHGDGRGTLLREIRAALGRAHSTTLLAYSFCSSHRKATGRAGSVAELTADQHWAMLQTATQAWNPDREWPEVIVAVGALREPPPAELLARAKLITGTADHTHQTGACEAIRLAAEHARDEGFERLVMLADDVLPTAISVEELSRRLGAADYVGTHWGTHRELNTQVFAARVAVLFDEVGRFRLSPHLSRVLEEQIVDALEPFARLDILDGSRDRHYFHSHDPLSFNSETAALQWQRLIDAEHHLTARRWQYVREGHDERPMRFEADGTISEGYGGQERGWRMGGGESPTLKIWGDAGEITWLRFDGQCWRGAWRFFERMPITLNPLEADDIPDLSISVIIPTLGRTTLPRMLESLRPQLGDRDEVIVVGDGPQPFSRATVAALHDARFRYLEHHDDRSIYGNAQRNFGVEHSSGDVLWFCDDDDEALPFAFREIRRELVHGVPVFFRMFHHGRMLWGTREMRPANIGGAIFILPRDRFRPWPVPATDVGNSDFEWILSIAGDDVRWSETPIYRYIERGHGR